MSKEPKKRGELPPNAWVPSRLCQDGRLSKTDLRVAIALYARRNRKTGLCFPSAATIAADTGVHATHVRASRRRLEKLGWLAIEARRNASGANQSHLHHLRGGSETCYPRGAGSATQGGASPASQTKKRNTETEHSALKQAAPLRGDMIMGLAVVKRLRSHFAAVARCEYDTFPQSHRLFQSPKQHVAALWTAAKTRRLPLIGEVQYEWAIHEQPEVIIGNPLDQPNFEIQASVAHQLGRNGSGWDILAALPPLLFNGVMLAEIMGKLTDSDIREVLAAVGVNKP
jgi:hypothetical protein